MLCFRDAEQPFREQPVECTVVFILDGREVLFDGRRIAALDGARERLFGASFCDVPGVAEEERREGRASRSFVKTAGFEHVHRLGKEGDDVVAGDDSSGVIQALLAAVHPLRMEPDRAKPLRHLWQTRGSAFDRKKNIHEFAISELFVADREEWMDRAATAAGYFDIGERFFCRERARSMAEDFSAQEFLWQSVIHRADGAVGNREEQHVGSREDVTRRFKNARAREGGGFAGG